MCFEIIFSLRLWDRHHDVANEDRPSLLRLFRRIVYAESSEAFEKAREAMEDDEVFKEYPNYDEHLTTAYFHRYEAWASCHRIEAGLPHHAVNTNNLVEASFKVIIITVLGVEALPLH